MSKYYPIMVNMENKKIFIIGGGLVAKRKAKSLKACDALVTIISPHIDNELKEMDIILLKKEYEYGDLKEANFVYIATNDELVNKEALKECIQRNILCNCAQNPEDGDFIIPSSFKRGSLNISVSTEGKSPGLSKKIRQELEEAYDISYEMYIEEIGYIRKKAIKEIKDAALRRKFFKELIKEEFLRDYKQGKFKNLRDEIRKIYTKYIK